MIKLLKRRKSELLYDNIDKICTTLILLFYVLKFLATILSLVQNSINTYLCFIIAIASGTISLFGKKYNRKTIGYSIIMFSLLIMLMIISALYNENIELSNILFYIQYIFLSLSLFVIKLWHKMVRFSTLGLLIFFVIKILSGVLPDNIFVNVSRNTLSVFVIIFITLYYVSIYENNIKINFIISSIGFVVVLWSGGRSGIYSCIFFLLATILGRYLQIKKTTNSIKELNKYIIVFILALSGALIYAVQNETLTNSILYIYRLKSKVNLFDDIRFTVILEYLITATRSVGNFLFGVPYDEVPSIISLANNPHNMYINLHANFGFFAFTSIGTLFIYAIIAYFKFNKMFGIIFISILMRGFSDNVGFYGLFDPLCFFFVFNAISKNTTIENDKYMINRRKICLEERLY